MDAGRERRCLNCGAAFTGRSCPGCGLTDAAASLLLRRWTLLRTGIFLLGSLAFLAAAFRFPPLELDAMLIFTGVLFAAGLALAVMVERRALRLSQAEWMKHLFGALVPVPWVLAALIAANGWLDGSRPTTWQTSVVGKFSSSAMLPNRRLVVRSWREGRTVERLSVTEAEFARFHVGDSVVVYVHPGLAGIPWIGGVAAPPRAGQRFWKNIR